MRTTLMVLLSTCLFAATGLAQQPGRRGGQQLTPQQQAERAAARAAEMRAPRPIDAVTSLWLEELTWMEIRDAVGDGNTTALIMTGGLESN